LEEAMLASDIVHRDKIDKLTEKYNQMNRADRIHIEAEMNRMALM
jgi:hypothetical protein